MSGYIRKTTGEKRIYTRGEEIRVVISYRTGAVPSECVERCKANQR